MGRDFVVIEWVTHQAVDNVKDWISFWAVVAQVDANQRQAPLESDSPPKKVPCEASSSIHCTDRTVAADGKTKKYAVGMNREGLLGRSPGTIYQPGLWDFSVAVRTSAVE